MVEYRNGFVPDSAVPVIIDRAPDGSWIQRMSPGTAAKHAILVQLAKNRTGKDLKLAVGYSAYRPYAAQVAARQEWGVGAAVPGTSSHGGTFEGRQTLAMDYGNWGTVYNWNQTAFFADARAAGLTPGMIMKTRGYPDEPWHVIDYDPWRAMPAGGWERPFPTETRKKSPVVFLKGPDRLSTTTPVLVVASPGVWDRYAVSFEAALKSQYGDPVVLSLDSMKQKEAQYLAVDDAIIAAVKSIGTPTVTLKVPTFTLAGTATPQA